MTLAMSDWTLVHTGVFATADEVREATRPVHHAEVAAGSMFGVSEMPIDRASRLCRAYLPERGGGARFAIDTETCELLYALPTGPCPGCDGSGTTAYIDGFGQAAEDVCDLCGGTGRKAA